MPLVRAFGLNIDTGFDLPGAIAVDPAVAEGITVDVVIAEGAAELADATAVRAPYALARDRLLFTADGVARYLCSGGNHIAIAPHQPLDVEHISALLIATALPALLWMRGNYVLHAAAFVPRGADGAIAISAPSGGGKSTLLAEALSRGAQMIADDSLSLDATGPSLNGSGLAGGYCLPDGSITRHFVAVDTAHGRSSAPLETLVILDRSGNGPPHVERLSTVTAIEALLAARHRPRVPALIADPRAHLAQTGLLAQRLAIYRLTVGTADPAPTYKLLMQELER